MIIKTKIEESDYIRFVFTSVYSGPAYRILIVIIACSLLSIPLYFLNRDSFSQFPYVSIILAVYFFVISPLLLNSRAKRQYASHLRLQEEIIYDFTPERLKVTGESFNSELNWPQTYKIAEFKKYFLIYPSKAVANIIPKNNMLPEEIADLRELFRNLPESIKKKLYKKD